MNDIVLNALVHLFALVASVNESRLTKKGKGIVNSYLSRFLNDDLTQEYLRLFGQIIKDLRRFVLFFQFLILNS